MLFSCCRFARAPAASSLGMGVANPLDRRGGLQRRSFGAVATWRRRQSLKKAAERLPLIFVRRERDRRVELQRRSFGAVATWRRRQSPRERQGWA